MSADWDVLYRNASLATLADEGYGTIEDGALAIRGEHLAFVGPAAMVTQSPTLTAEMTGAGMLLGTAAYMSPEQARGQVADRRADIWAFGIVMMEMLTGEIVFAAETVSDTLAGVLAREPMWDKLPKSTPRQIRYLLERCVEKDTRNRLQAIGEARIQIERFLENPEEEEVQVSGAAPEPTPAWKRLAPWLVAAVLAIALGAALLGGLGGGDEATSQTTRSSLEMPEGKSLHQGYGAPIALSPDGDRMVHIFSTGAKNEMFVRALDQWEGTPLAEGEGQERPYQPFFSPDGDWVGFVTPATLRKIPITGGTSIKLCDVNLSRGATWGPDGTIVFAANPGSGLSIVPDAGGEPQPLTELDSERSEATHRWPQFLPGGEQVLFTSHTSASGFESARIEIVELATGERQVVHQGGTYGRYVDSGHLVYLTKGALFAVPFDLGRLETTGAAAPVVQAVGGSPEGGAYYDVSSSGQLAFTAGGGSSGRQILPVWADREGQVEPWGTQEQDFRGPRFSPDGKFLAVGIATEGNTDIWVYDMEREVPSRLTFDEADDYNPVWSPDGQTIVFSSERGEGAPNIYRKPADGSGEVEQVTDSDSEIMPWSWSPDGAKLAAMQINAETALDLVLVSVETGEIEPFLTSSFVEYAPVFSPDGRYLAYGSDESGEWEVYVRPVDGSRGKWQVSSGGGAYPKWSVDGKEIFVGWEGGLVQSIPVDTSDGQFRVDRPQDLFTGPFVDLTGNFDMFTATPDGQRFLLFQGDIVTNTSGHQHVRLVSNWFAELEQTFSR